MEIQTLKGAHLQKADFKKLEVLKKVFVLEYEIGLNNHEKWQFACLSADRLVFHAPKLPILLIFH